MASPVKLSLEQKFAQRLHLRSNETSEEGAIYSTSEAAVTPSRHLELAPHNVRIRDYLKENDATFRRLDELKEKVPNTYTPRPRSLLIHPLRAGALQKVTPISGNSAKLPTTRVTSKRKSFTVFISKLEMRCVCLGHLMLRCWSMPTSTP